ncbi:MAG: hypothetical protein KBS82_08105 [Oscillospiraceae bacterium]|nr:hypothetical protein [Candidatus Limimonas egerieequi]
MEKLSNIFSMLTNTGADLELDDIFIIIFVSLVILALLLGYLLGRKVTGKEKKKIKAAKKMAKQEKAEAKKQAKLDKAAKSSSDDAPIDQPLEKEEKPAKEKPKKPKKEKKNKQEPDQKPDWFDADDNDDIPSAMPIIPERKTTTFIETKAKETEDTTPVDTEEKPLSKSEQKKQAKAEAYAKKLEAKEQKKAEKLSKKAAKKQPKDDTPETTIQVEPTESSEPITAEEMAKRLESLMGPASGAAVSLGAAEEEEVPKEEIGTIQSTQIPGRHNDNWVLEETKRQNEEADKKEAERKENDALPFAFGSDIEGSADDVQLSYKARKKLREEEEKKAQEEEKKERKHITSIFAKKQEEEVVEEEEDFFDENYMGEEIPDSLAGFGFSAAPVIENDEEKKDE